MERDRATPPPAILGMKTDMRQTLQSPTLKNRLIQIEKGTTCICTLDCESALGTAAAMDLYKGED